MSDFLKQFSDDAYKAGKTIEGEESRIPSLDPFEPVSSEQDAHETAQLPEEFSSDLSEDLEDNPVEGSESDIPGYEHEGQDQQEIIQQSVAPTPTKNPRQKITGATHVVKKDKAYDKKKIVRYLAIAASILALAALAFGVFFITNQVEVRGFVGVQVTEARTWGIQNRITIEVREVYSLDAESGVVLSQNREPETRISRGSVLSLEVSKGPDVTEVIELPDFEAMTTQEVREWRQEVAALNANVNEEYSAEVEQGRFIRLEFTDSSVTKDNYTRADGLLIYMSRGVQVFERNIVVPNFVGDPLSRAQEWAREQGIELKLEEAPHDTVETGNVSAQNIDADERIARGDELTLTVSQGPAITVPNFSTISFEDATEVIELNVRVQRRYSASASFGRLMSQSIPAGTELVGEGHVITVVYSLGRPYMDNLIGQSESVLAEQFYSFTSQGANITYQVFYVDGHEPRGTIVDMSRHGQFLSMSDHVRIDVSRGNRIPPEGFEPSVGGMEGGSVN
ncbi:MAG: PASTA domain-containing protein [Coriobacteriia bacterium]|nr:PASTA domain-containing protein [Coriobacteriia bacterium]